MMKKIAELSIRRPDRPGMSGLLCAVIACLALIAGACTDRNVNPTADIPAVENPGSAFELHASALLSGSQKAASHAKGAQLQNMHGFTSPLFGLATAQNGDILVADAGAGVSTMDGTVESPLPGITDLSPLGRGTSWALRGLSGSPGDDTGQALYRLSKGKQRMIADLFAFEKIHNPDGGEVDSNPFDVQSAGGGMALVADAGGNALLRVDNRGGVEVVAVFPNEPVSTDNVKNLVGCPGSQSTLCDLPPEIPAQPVPTSIAVGPGGWIYVGELKGFPAPTGESNIWRIAPDASWAMCGTGDPDCEKAFDGGFTSIIDLAMGPDGMLYVAELDEQSWFAVEVLGGGTGGTINACDPGMGTCSEMASGIPILTAITFGSDGSLWATRNALIPGMAEVFMVE